MPIQESNGTEEQPGRRKEKRSYTPKHQVCSQSNEERVKEKRNTSQGTNKRSGPSEMLKIMMESNGNERESTMH